MDNIPDIDKREDGKEPVTQLMDINITSAIVYKSLKSLKLNKAAGVDGLESTDLKNIGESLVLPLKILFKRSGEKGEIPEDWKRANISALFKKGSKKDPGNYRPVSLTSHVSKLLERIIKDEMNSHLDRFHLIAESQHGFMKKRSCLTNLLVFNEFVTSQVDEERPIDIIHLDFQNAFDKVPHMRLLKKLEAHGISGNVVNWIKSWLHMRKQRVHLDGCFSNWTDIYSGVPQRSVLGPILFTIFINDIDDHLSSKILKFADDTKAMSSVQTEEEINKLRQDLSSLYKWSVDWQMLFNVEKCKVMHIGLRNQNTKYQMGGKELSEVTEERDLGVIVSKDLKVGKQCAKAANKGNQILGMIFRTFE